MIFSLSVKTNSSLFVYIKQNVELFLNFLSYVSDKFIVVQLKVSESVTLN